jgi:hypothetical protein
MQNEWDECGIYMISGVYEHCLDVRKCNQRRRRGIVMFVRSGTMKRREQSGVAVRP